jgi:outer membrane immunogenic protein
MRGDIAVRGTVMKRFMLGSVALITLLGGSAMAADMAVKAPPAPPVCVGCNWNGFYLGVNVGGSIGNNGTSENISLNPPGGIAGVTNPLVAASHPLSTPGALAGFQAGWNLQSGNIVWGIEGDWAWTSQKATAENQNFFASSVVVAPSTLTYTDEQKIQWLATARGRLGITNDCFLWYVTGGAAFGEIRTNNTFQVAQIVGTGVFGPAAGAASFNTTKTGWTVGAGVETSLAWLGASKNWSTKLEYLYVDLGTVNNTFAVAGAIAGTTYTDASSIRVRDNIVRFGVNYRFGG